MISVPQFEKFVSIFVCWNLWVCKRVDDVVPLGGPYRDKYRPPSWNNKRVYLGLPKSRYCLARPERDNRWSSPTEAIETNNDPFQQCT